jgi:hypothetical protein
VPAKKTKSATVANPLFQSKPKNFRIGGDLRVSSGCRLLVRYGAVTLVSVRSAEGPRYVQIREMASVCQNPETEEGMPRCDVCGIRVPMC